jgi:hypothetical protein
MKIVPATCGSAPIVMLYGAEGRGKTTLASRFPKPVAMLLERGLPRGVSVDAIDGLSTYANVLEAMRDLCRDPNGYQTLVIDTLDALEPMLLDHLCGQRGWKDIEQPSYGKGFVAADEIWRGFIKGITTLRDRHGFTIVLVAHSTVDRFDDPRAPTYTQYAPKLHKRARALICDAADVIGFLAEDLRTVTDDGGFRERVRATSSSQRFLFVEGNPAFVAKNRYAMPPKIPVGVDFNIGELTKFWSHN